MLSAFALLYYHHEGKAIDRSYSIRKHFLIYDGILDDIVYEIFIETLFVFDLIY